MARQRSSQRSSERSRPRLSLDGITQVALALVDREGFEALSLSNVAGQLGVGPSALYSHVNGLDGLRYAVAVEATNNLTEQVRNAAIGVAGEDAIYSMGGAYRGFAHGHPGQYASTLLPPSSPDDDLATASQALIDVFTLVFRGIGLDPDRSASAASSTRSAIHGFLALEMATGSTPGHDEQYRQLLDVLTSGVQVRRS